jgi:SP family galactose:H+ symporter-like MFS transporter
MSETKRDASRKEPHSQQAASPPASKQHTPFFVYVAAAIAALGGFLFGYDTGVISGAEIYLKQSFHLNGTIEEMAVSAVLVGAIVGAAVSGWISDRVGRKIVILVMAAIFAAGAIVTALSPNIWFFIILRIIVGFALGADSVLAPVYISEIAPHSQRGALVTANQLLLTLGISVAYWVDLAFANMHMSWPPMFAVAVVPAAALFIGMLFLPDTPRWYASKGKWDKADRVLTRITSSNDKQQEMELLRKDVEEGKNAKPAELFKPGLRTALIVGVGLALFQQFVAINTIIYYAPTIFGFAGFKSASGAILATSVVGIVNLVSTLVAVFLVDRIGRRLLLLIGIAGMAAMLIAIGVIFLIGPTKVGMLILGALLIYIVAFAISMGPVYWVLSSEIFPNRLRGTGSSICTSFNWAGNLLISVTFLSLVAIIGQAFTFWLYAVFAIGAFVFCWFLVPETKGKRLEQIGAYWTNGRQWPEEAKTGQ